MLYRGPGAPPKEQKPTIKVLMLKDAVGAPDGITRTEYRAGETYDLPEDLAGCFFSTGEADPAEAYEQRARAPESPQEGVSDQRETVEGEKPAQKQKTRHRAH